MKFSVMELFQHPADKSPQEVIKDAVDQAVLAEELGFDEIWLAEHHFSAYGLVGSPLIMAAAIAQRTERIRIGTAVAVLPFYNPIRLAEECALVDQMSGGRLMLGVGRGYQPEEFRGFGIEPDSSRQRAAEVSDILNLAWTEDTFSYSGEYHNLEDMSVLPKPLQQPHPPVYHAAVSLSSFEAAGSKGQQILTSPNFTPVDVMAKQFKMYTDALEAAGFDPKDYDRPVMQKVYVGESEEEAHATARPHAEWYQALLASIVPGANGKPPKGYEQWARIAENMAKVSYDDIRRGSNFAGVENAIETVQKLVDVGVNKYIGWFSFGSMDRPNATASMRRFAAEVIPHFK